MFKLNKKFLSLFLAPIMMLSLSSCEKRANKNVDALDVISEDKVMTFAMEATYPPMEFADNKGELVGFEVDLARMIASKMRAQAKFINTDFAGITEGLNSFRYDAVISTMNVTEEREKSVSFSNPYIQAVGMSIIVRASENKEIDFKDLENRVIAVQQGSTADDYVKDMKFKEVKKYVRIADAFMDLKSKRVDAIVTDNVVGRYYMKIDKSSYKMSDKLYEAGPIAIAFNKKDVKLKNKTNEILEELKGEGELTKLSIKWFGVDIYKDDEVTK